MNEVTREFYRLSRTSHHSATLYIPRSNGTVETMNRDILTVEKKCGLVFNQVGICRRFSPKWRTLSKK